MKIAPHIDRFGDIRKKLVEHFGNDLLKTDKTLSKAYFKALHKKYGSSPVFESEEEIHELTDNFIYSYRFPDGKTIIDSFVTDTSELSEDDKNIVLGWKDPIEGIFEVKKMLPDGLIAENLVNEVEYIIKPTIVISNFSRVFRKGVFFGARIIPVSDTEYTFSGAQRGLNNISKTEVYRIAAEFQKENPSAAFRDNEEKIKQGFRMQKKDKELFIECFGRDEVITEGRKLPEIWAKFMEYKLKKSDKQLPDGYKPPVMDFPEDLLKSKEVGVVFDEVESLGFFINYGLIIDILQDPDEKRIKKYKEDILSYIKDESISPIILRRLFFRFPQNAEFVVQNVLNRPQFNLERDFDSLTKEFKSSHIGRKILPAMLPMSDRFAKALRINSDKDNKIVSLNERKVARNAPCPCGSGKKYKKCCGE